MITVVYIGSRLTVEGHSEQDPRACNGISLIITTLVEEYGAPGYTVREAPEPTSFVWDGAKGDGLRFALASFRVLARHYPEDVCFSE